VHRAGCAGRCLRSGSARRALGGHPSSPTPTSFLQVAKFTRESDSLAEQAGFEPLVPLATASLDIAEEKGLQGDEVQVEPVALRKACQRGSQFRVERGGKGRDFSGDGRTQRLDPRGEPYQRVNTRSSKGYRSRVERPTLLDLRSRRRCPQGSRPAGIRGRIDSARGVAGGAVRWPLVGRTGSDRATLTRFANAPKTL
jgi:hypothetical protein